MLKLGKCGSRKHFVVTNARDFVPSNPNQGLGKMGKKKGASRREKIGKVEGE